MDRKGRTCITCSPQVLHWGHSYKDSDIVAYKLLEVGKCRNGDPIIIGGVYVDDGGHLLEVLADKPKGDNRYPCLSDLNGLCWYDESEIKCLHQPKEEPLKKVREALEFYSCELNYDSNGCPFVMEKSEKYDNEYMVNDLGEKATEALKELDEYLEGK